MCQTDDCELGHCKKCGCHTIGNEFVAGNCQDCIDEDNFAWELEQSEPKNLDDDN